MSNSILVGIAAGSRHQSVKEECRLVLRLQDGVFFRFKRNCKTYSGVFQQNSYSSAATVHS